MDALQGYCQVVLDLLVLKDLKKHPTWRRDLLDWEIFNGAYTKLVFLRSMIYAEAMRGVTKHGRDFDISTFPLF